MNALSSEIYNTIPQKDKVLPTENLKISEPALKYAGKIKELFLLRLAEGNLKYVSNVREQAKQLNISTEQKHYVVFAVSVDDSNDAIHGDAAICMFEDKVRSSKFAVDYFMACRIDMYSRLICIVNVDAPYTDSTRLEEAILQLVNAVNHETGVRLCYGIGAFVDKLELLSESYDSAISILEHNLKIKNNAASLTNSDYFKNSQEIHKKLLDMFRGGDITSIQTAVKQHVNSIHLNVPGRQVLIERFAVRYLQNITNECMRLGITLERFESYVPAVVCLMQLDSAGSVDVLLQLTEQILKYISVHRTKEGSHLLNMAKDYIQENISNEKLDLATVGDHVGLSRVYFCKLFHQMEGISFSAYLKKVRIEKAKQLLLTTNMRIFEVGNAVGFSHAKYFGQVFKETVGQTPLEFKKGIS